MRKFCDDSCPRCHGEEYLMYCRPAMIIHLPPHYSTPRLARRGPLDVSDRPEYSRFNGVFVVDNCGYEVKRGKLNQVREVPEDLAEEIREVEHQRAALDARFNDLMHEAYRRGEPVRPFRLEEEED
jgi:hypothetical protein